MSLEERRIGDHAIGRFDEPGLAARARIKRIEAKDARPRLKAVALGVARGERREFGIDLDEIDADERRALGEREPDRADACADVDDPALAGVRRGGQQGRVRADPMAALRLNEREPAAEPLILGQPVPRGPLRHRAILFPDPPRR